MYAGTGEVAGCYGGETGPPQGTQLQAGETLTWKPTGDHRQAFTPDQYDPDWAANGGSPQNQAASHGGWELCFA